MMGSGFVVSNGGAGLRILTNHHVIEDAVDIRLTKNGNSRRWPAKITAIGADVDLALLEVTEGAEEFFRGLRPVVWSDELPALMSRVSVRGYPTGGTTLCITEGVVSRIDCKNYRLGVTSDLRPGNFLVIQIDAAINPGNSGGPCFDARGRVVGVAFQGIDRAQSIGYLIPATVALTFLASARNGYAGVQEVPFRSHHLENKSLRRHLQMPDDTTGVVITAVSPLSAIARDDLATDPKSMLPLAAVAASGAAPSPAVVADLAGGALGTVVSAAAVTAADSSASMANAAAVPSVVATVEVARSARSIQLDDVLVAIDGHAVGDDYTVRLRGDELIHADFLITGKRPGEPTVFDILRAGRPFSVTATLGPLPAPVPRTHGVDCRPQYLVIGGLLFAPLTAPLVEAAADEHGAVPSYVHDIYTSVVRRPLGFRTKRDGSETIVLLNVLASEVNYGYHSDGWRVLKSLNGEVVPTLAALHAMWRAAVAARTEELIFGFGDLRRSIVLSTQQCEESEASLLRAHGIPLRASPSIVNGSRTAALRPAAGAHASAATAHEGEPAQPMAAATHTPDDQPVAVRRRGGGRERLLRTQGVRG